MEKKKQKNLPLKTIKMAEQKKLRNIFERFVKLYDNSFVNVAKNFEFFKFLMKANLVF